jgi:hypothetical protein
LSTYRLPFCGFTTTLLGSMPAGYCRVTVFVAGSITETVASSRLAT